MIGNGQLKFPFDPPIMIYVHFNGMIYFGTEINVEDDEDSVPQTVTKWKNTTRNQLEANKRHVSEANTATSARARQGIKSTNAKTEKKPIFSIDNDGASVTPYLFGLLTYNPKSGHAVGEMSLAMSMAYQFSVSHEFTVGPVPAFIGFDFSASLTVGFSLGVQANINTWSNFNLSGNTGFNLSIEMKIGLTVGAGLPKVAYVALKGKTFVGMDLVLGPSSNNKPEFSAGLAAQVEVKVLFFSKAWTLWSYKWPSAGMQDFFVSYTLANTATPDNIPFVEDHLKGLGFTVKAVSTSTGETFGFTPSSLNATYTEYENPLGSVSPDYPGTTSDTRKPESEWQLSELLPTVSNDVKYMPTTKADTALAFFLGKCKYDNGKEGIRLYAAVL